MLTNSKKYGGGYGRLRGGTAPQPNKETQNTHHSALYTIFYLSRSSEDSVRFTGSHMGVFTMTMNKQRLRYAAFNFIALFSPLLVNRINRCRCVKLH